MMHVFNGPMSLRAASWLSICAACHNIAFYFTLHSHLATSRNYLMTPRLKGSALDGNETYAFPN